MSRQSSRQSSNKNSLKNTSGNEQAPPPPRLSQTTAIVPLVYGSISFFLGKKASEEHTHRWTLYVRGPNNEDLSVAIEKVIFHLHPSFPQPVRELTAPPFEVTERGWGEFEATIRIVWHDSQERATVLTHFIKLYPTAPTAKETGQTGSSSANNGSSGSGNSNKQEPVIHEFYDEVVFTDPTETFYEKLQRWAALPKVQSHEETIHEYLPSYSDDADFKALLEAERFLEEQLIEVKDRIQKADLESHSLDERILALTKGSNPNSKNPIVASQLAANHSGVNALRINATPNSSSIIGSNAGHGGSTMNKKQMQNKPILNGKVPVNLNATGAMNSKKSNSAKKQKTASS